MAGFTFNSAKKTVEDNAHVNPGRHNCTITRANAMTSKKSGDPMVIVNFKIRDDSDPDDGKEFPGFLMFTASDLSIQTIEQFCGAIGRDPESDFGDNELTVPFLREWSEILIGEMINVETVPGTGDYAGKPLARNYYTYGNLEEVDNLL